jgi:palmitoyltransferase
MIEAAFLSINLILSALVMISVGILTSYHIYCITTNTTTIEGWEKGRSLTIKGMGKIQNVSKSNANDLNNYKIINHIILL